MTKKYTCVLCDFSINSLAKFNKHEVSIKHKRKEIKKDGVDKSTLDKLRDIFIFTKESNPQDWRNFKVSVKEVNDLIKSSFNNEIFKSHYKFEFEKLGVVVESKTIDKKTTRFYIGILIK